MSSGSVPSRRHPTNTLPSSCGIATIPRPSGSICRWAPAVEARIPWIKIQVAATNLIRGIVMVDYPSRLIHLGEGTHAAVHGQAGPLRRPSRITDDPPVLLVSPSFPTRWSMIRMSAVTAAQLPSPNDFGTFSPSGGTHIQGPLNVLHSGPEQDPTSFPRGEPIICRSARILSCLLLQLVVCLLRIVDGWLRSPGIESRDSHGGACAEVSMGLI